MSLLSALRSPEVQTRLKSDRKRIFVKVDRRQKIVDVASALFAAQGIDQTTVRQIADKAGILSGSLYHHFNSKLDIVDAVLRDFCAEVLSTYRSIGERNTSATDALRVMIRYTMSLIPGHAAAISIVRNDFANLTRESQFGYLVDFDLETESCWVKIFRQGVERGEFNESVDPQLSFRFCREAIRGTLSWYRPSESKSIDELSDALVNLILCGVVSDGARSGQGYSAALLDTPSASISS